MSKQVNKLRFANLIAIVAILILTLIIFEVPQGFAHPNNYNVVFTGQNAFFYFYRAEDPDGINWIRLFHGPPVNGFDPPIPGNPAHPNWLDFSISIACIVAHAHVLDICDLQPPNGCINSWWWGKGDNIGKKVIFNATGGVGGVVIPVDKFGLLAPYIGLTSTILVAIVATSIYVNRVKHRKEK